MGDAAAVQEQFGPYLVYERLGVGGMATVHRARELGIEGFERIVALKRLLPHLAEDASFIKSFVREAKLASILNHVNIVQIFELGRVGSEYFISMEYIDGKDVRQILRHARRVSGPPPIHIGVGLLLQLCDALDYAHTKADEEGHPLQLVHRDVSPSNLLVTTAGHLKVIDFGIAKAQSQQLRTQTGRVKGKLAYMAPEAIAGKDLDARSDLFAAGVILHELLTARPLFASKNEYETLLKVQRGDILPPSTFNQACPPELDAIVLKALARDPDTRYASASELRDDLHDLRRLLNLQTGVRDIAGWIDWAFSLEAPSGSFASTTLDTGSRSAGIPIARARGQISGSVSSGVPAPPSPSTIRHDHDDAEAVEIAWGGGGPGSGPLLLDDIPDVSEKHLAAASGAIARSSHALDGELDHDDDDIPTPLPSHGRAPSGGIARAASDSGHVSSAGLARVTSSGMSVLDRRDTEPSGPAFGDTKPRIARTSPGMAPAKRATRRSSDLLGAGTGVETAPPKAMTTISIGASIASRQRSSRVWSWLLVLLLLGGGGTAVALYVMRDKGESQPAPGPVQPAKTDGTLRIQTEPANAEASLDGKPVAPGTASFTLPAGTHQIEIHHAGYKAWLTSIDLAAGEIQTLRVVLEPLGAGGNGSQAAAASEATLKISSSPANLEIVLDGTVLEKRTPYRSQIKPGPHTVVLRKDGNDVWRQELTAQPNINYEYNPSFDRPKTDAPAQVATKREAPTSASTGLPAPTMDVPSAGTSSSTSSTSSSDSAIDRSKLPSASTTLPPPVQPTTPTPTPTPPTPTPAVPTPMHPAPSPPTPTGPVTVAPTAVTRLSGGSPSINKGRNSDIPAVIAAKVCIDVAGHVSSADVITKIERHAAADLVDAIKQWQYAPYKRDGKPLSACFVVSLRLK